MKSIHFLSPKSENFLNIDGIKFMVEIYKLNIEDMKAECHSVKRLLEPKSLNLETVTEFLQFMEPFML